MRPRQDIYLFYEVLVNRQAILGENTVVDDTIMDGAALVSVVPAAFTYYCTTSKVKSGVCLARIRRQRRYLLWFCLILIRWQV